MKVYKSITPIYMKEKYWRKMTWEQQEKLTTYKNIILTDPIPTKKELALKVLNKIDYTTKEGREFYSNLGKKYDKYTKKFEDTMEKVDKAFDDVDKSLGKTSKKKDKDPIHFELWGDKK